MKKTERNSPAPATRSIRQAATKITSRNLIEIFCPEIRQTKTSGIKPIPKLTRLESADARVKI
jgi:hypothetical protein